MATAATRADEPKDRMAFVELGHFVRPVAGGQPALSCECTELPSKPPLFHWLGAATSLIRGQTDEWSIRFPSAALSLLALLGVFAAGNALWGAGAGLVAALSLMTTFEWARAATSARVDMALTAGLEAAFLGFLFFLRSRRARWLVVLYLGIAFAALGKGPVGVALPGGVVLLTLICTRDFALLRQMRLLRGALAVAVIAGSWYLLAFQLGGADFFRKQVLNENLFRFVGASEFSAGHRHSNLTLFGLLLLGSMPWTLFLPPVVAALWRRRREISFRGGELYCVVWIAVVFGFYAFATSKRSVYLLALYPAVALLIGWWWSRVAPGGVREAWTRIVLPLVSLVAATAVAVVLLAVVLESSGIPILHVVAGPLATRDAANVVAVADAVAVSPVLAIAALSAGLIALAVFGISCARWHRHTAFAALFVSAAALIVMIRIVVLPGIARHETPRELIRAAKAVVGPADAMFFYRTFDYGAVFYSDGHIPRYEGSFPEEAPRFLLMSRSEWERLRPRVVNDYERVRLPVERDGLQRLVLLRRISAG